jgi:hypothetical protein
LRFFIGHSSLREINSILLSSIYFENYLKISPTIGLGVYVSNLERDRLLSDLEFERLKNRSKETHTRATNDGRVRRKLSAWLKNLDNVFFIMQTLPENQLKDVFGEKDIEKLYSIIGEAARIKNYYPPALEQWRDELERKETEIFKLRHGGFLQQDLQGPISYSKPLIELIQQGNHWTEENLLRELNIDSKDSDAVKITARQLERLAKFGLVRKEEKGWVWSERD